MKDLREKNIINKSPVKAQILKIWVFLCLFIGISSQAPGFCFAENLKASWYSIESLKQEGTYKYSKGVMANGEKFNENLFTCATRLYPFGSILRVSRLHSDRFVIVRVTDRIGKKFATKRIDLSKMAFLCIAELEKGIVAVKVERIR